MYLPTAFATSDDDLVWSVVEENPFGILLDPIDASASYLPFLVARTGGRPDRLRGHVACRNPVAARLEGRRVTALFHGPHAYVSPSWYEEPDEQVPTWNYVAVQVQGTASILGSAAARHLLDDLCARFEGPDGYRPSQLRPKLLGDMLAEIVAFEIVADRAIGKFKLSQNRSQEDRKGVMEGLAGRASGEDLLLLEWMRRCPR